MATSHKLKKYEYSAPRDRWRAHCADCIFIGAWASDPDRATDSFEVHKKESALYPENAVIYKQRCDECGQEIVLNIEGKISEHRSANVPDDWCPGGDPSCAV